MSDNNKMVVRFTQEEAAYTPVSTTAGEACAGCRWFTGEAAGGPACAIVEMYPLDIEPTGYCNKYAGVENAMLEQVVNVEPVPVMAEQEMAHGENPHIPETYREYLDNLQPETIAAPDSNNTNVLKTLIDKFIGFDTARR